MAEGTRVTKRGRPRKYSYGWDSGNRRIYVSNVTFVKWRMLREERSLSSDDAVAHYLLTLYDEKDGRNHESLCLPNFSPSIVSDTCGLPPHPIVSSTPYSTCTPSCNKTLRSEKSDAMTLDGEETLSVNSDDDLHQSLLNITKILHEDVPDSGSSDCDSADEDDEETVDATEIQENMMDITTTVSNEMNDPGGTQEPSPTTEDGNGTLIICSVRKLLELIGVKCPEHKCQSSISVGYEVCGCCIKLYGCCTNGHKLDWVSSDFHSNSNGNRFYNININFASAIVLSGNSFAKLSTFFKFMNVATISRTTFHSYQRHFICPAVNKFYVREQAKLLDKFRLNDLILSGDGRCDSPGKSAKFCTYSMMEATDNQILHFENVDKREVALQSPNMEREGMVRCLNFLLSSGMKISEVVTDSSTSVAKTLETDYPAVHHSRDVWHKAKKLRKALSEAGKLRGMNKINQWANNIINHFWFCCRTCDGDLQKLKEKWVGLLHHVVNQHEWVWGECEHEPMSGPPTDNSNQEITYFRCGEPAFLLLQRIVTDRTWLESLKSYTKFRHTGMLESFHSLLLGYCTKRTAYQNEAYLARVQLAILDHNVHTGRENALNRNGDIIYHRKYRKQTKKWDVTPTKSIKEYKYIPELMKAILEEQKVSVHNLKHQVTLPREHPTNIQATIAHTTPDKTAELVKNKRTRFA